LAYQRTAHDFFIPDDLREELTRKAQASRQILPSSNLPAQVDHFHSLVPLDTSNQKNAATFGYPTWVYKAVSAKDGYTYALRRLEGYRLTDEKAIRELHPWKRIRNASVVNIHDAFTTRAFGDSSLIFVTDYHPLSKTIAEQHFHYVGNPRYNTNRAANHVPEQVLWGYIVQLASALKAIHSTNLAVRCLSASKVIITSKSRVRLNGVGILDVVQHDSPRTIADMQADDLVQLGKLILCIAGNSATALQNTQKALDNITRLYTQRLKDCVTWLLNPAPPLGTPLSPAMAAAGQQLQPQQPTQPNKDIDTFLTAISPQLLTVLDADLTTTDTLSSHLSRELENARLVRLLAKLHTITERPEFEHNPAWSETGERYYIKLFRDYVFHQVDAAGRPVVDLGFVVGCLNKLDAGSEEKVCLTSRDEQTCFGASFGEIKRGVGGGGGEWGKGGGGGGGAGGGGRR